MFALLHSLAMFVIDFFKSPRRLEAENLFLRHQLSIALRRAPSRLRLRGSDRALLVWMARLWPSLLGAAQVVQPETILRWHRAGLHSLLASEIPKASRAAAARCCAILTCSSDRLMPTTETLEFCARSRPSPPHPLPMSRTLRPGRSSSLAAMCRFLASCASSSEALLFSK